ncbi:MAG: hypothetical protein MZV63_23130 [Marinilabiliales bacterium]|nr:hypothetical protein [Marinilabiliales bacterium]
MTHGHRSSFQAPRPRAIPCSSTSTNIKVEKLVSAQRKLVTTAACRRQETDQRWQTNEKGGLLLLRAYKGLPKNNALIKFLSEEGVRSLLQKTENLLHAE